MRPGRALLLLLAVSAAFVALSVLRLPSDAVRGPVRFVAFSFGTCGFFADGSARCWGAAPIADHRGDRPWAHLVSPPVRDVAPGSFESWLLHERCVVTTDDVLECAPANARGWADWSIPEHVERRFGPVRTPRDLHALRSPLVALDRVCVIARAGSETVDSVFCLDRQALTSPTPAILQTGFRRMPLGSPTAIAMGRQQLCALSERGVRCLDMATDEVRDVPRTEGAVQLVVGEDFGCVRDTRGVVSCWGNNHVGQLGDGTFESRSAARALPGVFTDVAAFGRRACALRDGAPWCWGRLRPAGALPRIVAATPVRAADLDDLRSLVISEWHACGVRIDGTVWCWGNDAAGQLGNGNSMPNRGCSREGISGTSPEQEQMQPPTPVRTGDAGAYPYAHRIGLLIVTAMILGGASIVPRTRTRTSVFATLVVTSFLPPVVMRLANLGLVVRDYAVLGGWEEWLSWRTLERPLQAGIPLILSSAFVALGWLRYRRATDETSGARTLGTVLALGAIPSLLLSMAFTTSINDHNSSDGLPYLLRDRAIENLTWPFTLQWVSTVLWVAVALGFALYAHVAVRAKPSEVLP